MNRELSRMIVTAVLVLCFVAFPAITSAHCDAYDGPVITTARSALDNGNVTPVLKWVAPGHEDTVTVLFERVLEMREVNDTAAQIAETHFLETLVRLHRETEGETFTGLKPAGQQERIVQEVDRAMADGNVDSLLNLVLADIREGITHRFEEAREAEENADQSVAAGREFVHAYVEFMHYVRRLHQTAAGLTEHGH
jgi:hypothetical protein